MARIPSPADRVVAEFTSAGLLAHIRERGGRVHRMLEPPFVFCLTTDPDLASWLCARGGKSFLPPGLTPATRGPRGGYVREREKQTIEWDVYVHTIPTTDAEETSVWQAVDLPESQPASMYEGEAVA